MTALARSRDPRLALSRRIVALAFFLGALRLALPAGTAHAQSDVPASDDEEAHLRFEAGRVAFSRGRFEDALADFQRAYALSHRYALLYNIGQAFDRLRRDDEAIDALEQFLAEAPADDPNRAEVEARIGVMRAAREHAQAAAVAAQPPPPAPAPAPPALDPGPWIVVGVGGAIVVAGAIVLALGVSDQATVENATAPMRWASLTDTYERAPILQGVGVGALVLGVAGVAVGLAWGLSGSSGSTSSDHARLRLGPGTLTLEGQF